MTIESLSAITHATTDMARWMRFYEEFGFELTHGGPGADFSTFAVGHGYLNLQLRSRVAFVMGAGASRGSSRPGIRIRRMALIVTGRPRDRVPI